MFINRNRAPGDRMQAGASVDGVNRRRFLAQAGAGIGAVATPGLIRVDTGKRWRGGNPFSLGIASGAPRPDGFVLWTRLAPEPLSTNPETPGGMSGADVTLRYEIATDPGMAKIVRRGSATAEQAFAYSVHLKRAGPTGIASSPAMRSARSAARLRYRPRRRRSKRYDLVSCPAPITSTDIFPPTAT